MRHRARAIRYHRIIFAWPADCLTLLGDLFRLRLALF